MRVFPDLRPSDFSQRAGAHALARPSARLMRVALLAAIAWSAVEIVHLSRGAPSPAGSSILSRPASPNNVPGRPRLQVSVTIQPPAYTGLKPTAAVDPEQLRAIEGS